MAAPVLGAADIVSVILGKSDLKLTRQWNWRAFRCRAEAQTPKMNLTKPASQWGDSRPDWPAARLMVVEGVARDRAASSRPVSPVRRGCSKVMTVAADELRRTDMRISGAWWLTTASRRGRASHGF